MNLGTVPVLLTKTIRKELTMAKKPAKKQQEVLRYEELEQRLLFSADLIPGLDQVAAVDEQVLTADETPQPEPEVATPVVNGVVAESRWELVFVNNDVEDYEQLIADLQGHDDNRVLEVVVLESDRDGIEQVSEILADRSNLDAVHFITHGSDGQINLGNSLLDLDSLESNNTAIQNWASALTEDADLLIYGCNLAATTEGEQLVDSLAQLTGADVAASDDLTGHEDLGGDWDLEYDTGSIETSVAVSEVAQTDYESVLATYTVSNTNDSGAGSLRQAIIDANASANSGGPDTITFNIGADGSQQTINLSSALDPISEAVTIDGFSQYGALTPTTPLIELNGSSAGASVDGLTLAAGSDGSTIQGLVINNFDYNGIVVRSHNNVIWLSTSLQ